MTLFFCPLETAHSDLACILPLCTGLGQLLVSEKSMEKHGVSWMLALKAAVEGRT